MIRHQPALMRNRFMHTSRQVEGHSIQIPANVMDPVLFKTGQWFALRMRQHWASTQSVLDLGCGAGLLGVLAQADGLRVTATDLSPEACRAAKLNGVQDVRQGEWFEPVLGEQFDHICINPPYYQHVRWLTPFKRALVGSREMVDLLLNGYSTFLNPDGHLWIATGKGADWLEGTLHSHGFNCETELVDGEPLFSGAMVPNSPILGMPPPQNGVMRFSEKSTTRVQQWPIYALKKQDTHRSVCHPKNACTPKGQN